MPQFSRPLHPLPALWAVAACVWLAASPVGAEEGSPIFAGAAARGGAADGIAEKVGLALGSALAERGAVSLARTSDGSGAPARRGFVELDRLRADARGRYLEGDFEGAARQVDEATERFERRLAFEADDEAWRALTELLLIRALALGRQGQHKSQDRVLAQLAALRPSYVPDPGLAPPKIASRYQQVRSRVERKRATLEVTSRPAGAAVLLDGVKVGVTPLRLDDVLTGRHYVSVRLGAERHDEDVVARGGALSVRAELGDPRRPAAERLVDELARGLTERVLLDRAGDIDDDTLVAAVEPSRGRFTVFLARVRGGRLHTVSAAQLTDDLGDLDEMSARLAARAISAEKDGWLSGEDADGLRPRFLSDVAAQPTGGEGGGVAGLVAVSVGVGALAVLAVGATAGAILFFSAPTNPGGIDVVVDASKL